VLSVLIPLLIAFLAAPVVAVVGTIRPKLVPPVAAAIAGSAFAAVLWGWGSGGGTVQFPWAPTWNLNITFTMDGLGALYSMLASGIGLAVVVYSAGYLPAHLHHQHRPVQHQVSFYAFVLLFMGSMMGLVMAQDLILIFVFWDLTAISSYFLIGYDRHASESRTSALMALLVTGITAVLFLIGSLMLFAQHGTFALPELIAAAEDTPYFVTAAALMAVAGLAKSAPVPFHFWLPRAMAAPTPVSAYLHSAAMVAAGVFLIGRIYPLLAVSEVLLNALLVIGLASMAVAGVIALTRDVMKQLLAYSTIAQYGYVVTMFGLGGTDGVLGASYYVLAHALAKSALFLTAGAVTTATEETRISHLGGLRRSMPVLAVASGVAAATLAGLPLTVGFFKDELFFHAAAVRGWPFPIFAVAGAGLTLAYTWRFWSGVFLGRERSHPHPISQTMVVPIVVLGFLALLGSFATAPFGSLAEAAAAASLATIPVAPVSLAYHLDTRLENLLAVATWTFGGLLIFTQLHWAGVAAGFARTGERAGPERWYRSALHGLNEISSLLHALEVRDLRERVAAILFPTTLLVGAALLATPWDQAFVVGDLPLDELPLIMAVLISGMAAVVMTVARSYLALVLLLSTVGYSLAVVYAFFGGPDVALVAVLVETIFTLLLLGMLALLPKALPRERSAFLEKPWRRWRDPVLAVVAGGFALVVAWAALSQPAAETIATAHIELTPTAHANDIVTAILADFRGLDTMGEITVIAIAMFGVVSLLRRERST
jgi:multicomponent Na+:H+ antiporter subunit A